jgi:hypothetical protein
MPHATRHDKHRPGPQRRFHKPILGQQREIKLPLENLQQLIADRMALPQRMRRETRHPQRATVE